MGQHSLPSARLVTFTFQMFVRAFFLSISARQISFKQVSFLFLFFQCGDVFFLSSLAVQWCVAGGRLSLALMDELNESLIHPFLIVIFLCPDHEGARPRHANVGTHAHTLRHTHTPTHTHTQIHPVGYLTKQSHHMSPQ